MSNIPNIHTLISDIDQNNELLLSLKRRKIEQKFLYSGENATRYYNYQQNGEAEYEKSLDCDNLKNFISKNIDISKFTALISLGCGDTKKELSICKALGSNIELFAVDSSRSMIDIAAKNLDSYDGKYKLMLADFISPEFHHEISAMTIKHSHRIFAFLGSTLGNVSQTEMLDTLYNTMKSGDMIWISVMIRPDLSRATNLKIFESSQRFIEKKDTSRFCFDPLQRIGIDSKKDGKMVMDMVEEASIGVLKSIFSFEFTKPVSITYRGELIHFLPPEKVTLMVMRDYHPDTMIKFFTGHDFKLKNQEISNSYGQFLFQKN